MDLRIPALATRSKTSNSDNMLKTKYLIAIIVLIFAIGIIASVCLMYKNENPVEVIQQTYDFHGKKVKYYKQSFEDGRLLFAVCDNDRNWNCKIMQYEYPYKNATRSCNVTLTMDKAPFYDFLLVTAFGENKTILVWSERDEKETAIDLKLAVVHLDNCRKTDSMKLIDSNAEFHNLETSPIIDQLNRKHAIVTYNDNTFEMFFKDPRLCGERDCRAKINADEKFKSTLTSYANSSRYELHDVHTVADHSAAKGLVYTKSRYSTNGAHKIEYLLYLIQSNGSETQLESFTTPVITSVVNETIGACSTVGDAETTCFQYNSDGGLKLNVTFSHKLAKLLNVYSLPEGGFLLHFIEFKECTEGPCVPQVKYSYVMKIDATGKQVGKALILGSEKEIALLENYQIWKASDKEHYCVLMLYHGKAHDAFDILVNCFTKANFF